MSESLPPGSPPDSTPPARSIPWLGIVVAAVFLSCNQQFFRLGMLPAMGIAVVILAVTDWLFNR